MKISNEILKIPNRQTTSHELVYIAKIPPIGLSSYNIIAKRTKRSLIKKLSKNQQKTYFLRQVANNKSIFDDDDVDETTPDNTIDFGNINKEVVSIDETSSVVTPRITATKLNYTDESTFETTTTVGKNTANVNSAWIYEKTKQDEEKEDKYYYEESKDTFIRNQVIYGVGLVNEFIPFPRSSSKIKRRVDFRPLIA